MIIANKEDVEQWVDSLRGMMQDAIEGGLVVESVVSFPPEPAAGERIRLPGVEIPDPGVVIFKFNHRLVAAMAERRCGYCGSPFWASNLAAPVPTDDDA